MSHNRLNNTQYIKCLTNINQCCELLSKFLERAYSQMTLAPSFYTMKPAYFENHKLEKEYALKSLTHNDTY